MSSTAQIVNTPRVAAGDVVRYYDNGWRCKPVESVDGNVVAIRKSPRRVLHFSVLDVQVIRKANQ
jgi:hypothetical protein